MVVNAGGMYAPQIGRMAGVEVPIIPYAHEFLVTEAFDPPLEPLPTLRDPDRLIYFRTEVGGLIMGGYERNPAAWALDGVPDGFEAQLLPEDWERFDELLTNSVERVPAMETAEVRKLFNGPEAFTPDGEFILGESDVPGFWVAAGFCAHGLAGAGGMGWQVAEWIVNGEPSLDLWHMDSRRFGRQYRSQAFTLARATEIYATYYDIKYPNHEREAGRPLRLSPAYDRVAGAGRRLRREVGVGAAELVRAERRAGRRGPAAAGLGGPALVAGDPRRGGRDPRAGGLFDESSFAKIEVSGPGAVGVPPADVRERRRQDGRVDHLHPDAELAGRDRVRLHGHPSRRRPVPDRHGHRVRKPRPGLDQKARARRRIGAGGRRHVGLGVPGDLGPAVARHPPAADEVRPLERRRSAT